MAVGRVRTATLGKSFTYSLCHEVAVYSAAVEVTLGVAESNGSLPPGLAAVTCVLTAEDRDQLRNPIIDKSRNDRRLTVLYCTDNDVS